MDNSIVDNSCKNITDCYQYAKKISLNYLKCVSGKCQFGRMLNDLCEKNSDCWGNQKCNDGKCSGVKIGGACSPLPYYDNIGTYQECEWNALCTSKKCVARIKDGSKCNVYEPDTCLHGSFCNPSNKSQNSGKCQSKYSLPENSYCDENSWCKNGLVCDSNSKVCKNLPELNLQFCTLDSDCQKDSTCICDSFVGKGYCVPKVQTRDPCISKIYEYYQCIESNQCTQPQNLILDKKTCAYQECQTPYLSVISCYYCGDFQKLYGTCMYCPLSFWQKILVWGLWKFILIIISSVILLSIVIVSVVILVYKLKKRHQGYERIVN